MQRFVRRLPLGPWPTAASAASRNPGTCRSWACCWSRNRGFAVTTGPSPSAYVDNMMAAGAQHTSVGVLSVITFPLLQGQMQVGAGQMREHFPAWVRWVCSASPLACWPGIQRSGNIRPRTSASRCRWDRRRIVILGSGFARMKTGMPESELQKDPSVSISWSAKITVLFTRCWRK